MACADPVPEMFSPRDTRSAAALRHRYHELLKLYHPDRHADHVEWANRMIRAVIAAYNTLRTTIGARIPPPRPPDLRALLRAADQDVRRAVLLGWLRRLPRGTHGSQLRGRIAAARSSILARPFNAGESALIDSYGRLLAAFLDATDPCGIAPQPYSWRTPHVFRDLRLANELLEKGIRDYYYYRERGRLPSLGGVALSYLADASRCYAYVSRRLEPGRIREVAQSRIAIARLFEERIRHLDPG